MEKFIPFLAGLFVLGIGAILGYYARQALVKKRAGSLEKIVQGKISEAKKKAQDLIETAKKQEDERRKQLLKTEHYLLKRESILEQKLVSYEKKEREFGRKVEELKGIKGGLENLRVQEIEKLEKISQLSKEDAKKELFQEVEEGHQKEILEKIKKLEQEGKEKLGKRAKEILAFAIQKCALSQAQEITTSTVALPSDEVKGRIIGKEGRNIRTLEKLTGVEIVVDETPETVLISGFDPIRRQIAKTALEKLLEDGRIQPARIEEIVDKTQEEINGQIKEAGAEAVYETGVIGLDPKLVNLLGRLKFRTSYGQNVLLHSIEVCHIAGALAAEIGAKVGICKKAGLLHDIGKSVDQQVEGSHVDIGIKILDKFGVEKEVISAMKSHHEEYPYETIEAVLVQAADQISGARPGARKDTLENYLKRLEDLEEIATSFPGVEKAWALHAGKEIRVFVKPQEIDDLASYKLAKDIANRVQEELRYPGEIKVTLIRENRVVEYAK
jgi:ribonuclease Y